MKGYCYTKVITFLYWQQTQQRNENRKIFSFKISNYEILWYNSIHLIDWFNSSFSWIQNCPSIKKVQSLIFKKRSVKVHYRNQALKANLLKQFVFGGILAKRLTHLLIILSSSTLSCLN